MVRKVKCRPEEIKESAELVEYHIYDMFDKNNPTLKFTDRIEWVADNVKGNMIKIVETNFAHDSKEIDEQYGQYTSEGYEGQMIRQDAPYECKRSKTLLKRKEFITEEYDVVRVEEGNGNWTGYAKRFILAMPNGTQFSSGVRGSQAQLKALWESTEKPTWVTCRYFELSNDGIPRFPVVIDYGTGKRDD